LAGSWFIISCWDICANQRASFQGAFDLMQNYHRMQYSVGIWFIQTVENSRKSQAGMTNSNELRQIWLRETRKWYCWRWNDGHNIGDSKSNCVWYLPD
jgi:hypothetical protein